MLLGIFSKDNSVLYTVIIWESLKCFSIFLEKKKKALTKHIGQKGLESRVRKEHLPPNNKTGFDYMTLWERRDFRDSTLSSGCQIWGGREKIYCKEAQAYFLGDGNALHLIDGGG